MRKAFWGMLVAGALLAGIMVSGLPGAGGPGPRAQPAQRDGYLVLAVSWTPSWCAAEGDSRGAARCAADAGAGWLVHGLWPQHDNGGWPEFCASPHPAPRATLLEGMVDIMGDAGLAAYQWRKHGSCTGLDPAQYFAQTRAAFTALEFPEVLGPGRMLADSGQRHAPEAVLAAFHRANPAFTSDSMVLTCRDGKAQDIRLCLTNEGAPRTCDAALLARSCRARQVTLPPVR